MNTIHVIASGYADDYFHVNIGGIESYIQLLSLAMSESWHFVVYQPSKTTFDAVIGKVNVVGLGPLQLDNIVNIIEATRLKGGDVLIFSTDQYCVRTKWVNSAVIQHGISWDLPTKYLTSSFVANKLETVYRIFLSLRNKYRIKSFNNVVCVDYNYVNWYRTLATRSEHEKRFFVIPNCAGPQFTYIPKSYNDGSITICFARRFVAIRGIYLFIEIARKLLAKYDNVKIIFSGDGHQSLIEELQQLFMADTRVKIIKGVYIEMPNVYRSTDILVIPSLASEGTSLTAVEAMAMGKCVVASDVGGLTNIIIDGHNGFLASPSVDSLFKKLCFLVENPDQISRVGKIAKHISDDCFTFEAWAERWREVIMKVCE